MLSPGVQLGNRYRLDERIASGGMGDVWRGTDQVLGRTVAVKSLLPALLDEPGFAERFRGEARTMATINHPGVVDVYDFGSDQQIAFLVMEYIEGDPLSATLSRVGRLTPARTMALVAQAADALHAAHVKGIVHRDVKPGNLLVRPNGTLVLTDFGIARSELVGQLTAAGSVLGTASYISPEQATGQVATPASDVYALGVVAYQCLAGRRPFEGDNPLDIAMRHVRETPRPLPSDIPPQVCALVERAMAKDPKDRWASAAVLAGVARQLKAALSRQARPGGSAPISAAPASPAPVGRNPATPPPGRAQVPQPPRPPAAPHSPAAPRPPAAPHAPAAGHRPVAARQPVAQPRPTTVAPAATGYPRGAAPIPQAYAPQAGQSRPAPRRSRSGMWFLAILLGTLVVVCSGVVSYRLKDSINNSMPVEVSVHTVTSGVLGPDGRDDPALTAYRRLDQPRPGDETTTSEGRRTR
ncbi:serine/threonine-protein kinase [Micromonospora maris]|uniref:non-specific serine/threonine protein kinase n=1 Tax=Micromonospora maris TaxID=1003110 RepID=A0A9X0I691_9ACTN|nr:serine/threonine-protein kinase [Micromonospora maris]AEB42092.1 serine/threonine-protein kinase-like domain-containing protein [Micromonospora maris AB-18-032]KUJ47621.1 serine/threonine protein kinase [Micromonospora maris]